MNKGIIRSSENIEISDIILSEWNVLYNSKTYVDVELIFNSNIDTIFSDYNYINGTPGLGLDGLKIYLKDVSIVTELTMVKNGDTYSTPNVNGNIGGSYNVSPLNNSLRFNYNPSTFLISGTTYTIVVKIHDGTSEVAFEREFKFDDSINIHYADHNDKKTFTILPVSVPTPSPTTLTIDSSTPLMLAAYAIKSDDVIKFAIQNEVNGITSGVPTSINNSSGVSTLAGSSGAIYYGTSYNSIANFPFTVTPLAQPTDFIIDQTKKVRVYLQKTSEWFDVPYTHLTCYLNNAIDSTNLDETQSTTGTYTMLIPVMKDVTINDIQIKFRDASNNIDKLSSNGGNFDATVSVLPLSMNSGTVIFTANYAQVPIATNGSAWGTVEVYNTNNDFKFTKSLSYTVTPNDTPTISSFINSASIYNGNYYTGDNITFTATATDIDGTISKINFYENGTLIGFDTSSPYTLIHPMPSVGSYSYTAKAVDNLNEEGIASTAIPITVITNTAPTGAITIPSAPGNFGSVGQALTFEASASDLGDNVLSVVFYRFDGVATTSSLGPGTLSSGTVTNGTYTIGWTGILGNGQSIHVVVTDNHGLTYTSPAVNFNIT